jgi:hypothetical protein
MATGMQLMQHLHHLFAALAVQGAGWLIRQNDVTAVHQRPGNTDPLLLATGKLIGTVINRSPRPSRVKEISGTFLPEMLVCAGIDGRYLGILNGGQMGQQVVALEDKSEVFTPSLANSSFDRLPVSRPSIR